MAKGLSSLESLKANQLKQLLGFIGCPRTGSKSDLVSRLRHHQQLPRIRYRDGRARILSIDMGIRNLAFCVSELQQRERDGSRFAARMNVIDWKRLDLSKTPTVLPGIEDAGSHVQQEYSETNDPLLSPVAPAPSYMVPGEAFTPDHLAPMAYKLLKEKLLIYEPHIILIERQRYRSGGGSAVLEWTLRVNMLEGMLWACLETLKRENLLALPPASRDVPDVYGVSPQRVSSFWIDQGTDRKTVKKDKIDVVQKWLAGMEAKSTEIETKLGSEIISLSFSGAAKKTSELFESKAGTLNKSSKTTRSKGAKETEKIGKIDDLADCLLQATAWLAWETNRMSMTRMDIDRLSSLL